MSEGGDRRVRYGSATGVNTRQMKDALRETELRLARALAERDHLKQERDEARALAQRLDTNLDFGSAYADACDERDILRTELAKMRDVVEAAREHLDWHGEIGHERLREALATLDQQTQGDTD
jgi:hypothetical protein